MFGNSTRRGALVEILFAEKRGEVDQNPLEHYPDLEKWKNGIPIRQAKIVLKLLSGANAVKHESGFIIYIFKCLKVLKVPGEAVSVYPHSDILKIEVPTSDNKISLEGLVRCFLFVSERPKPRMI
jgi:hypothetical protein